MRSVGVWHQQTLLPLAVLSVVKPRPCSAKTAGTQRTRSVMVGDPRVASSEVAKKIVFRNVFLMIFYDFNMVLVYGFDFWHFLVYDFDMILI